MKMENWLEVINREIREMQKHNKYLEKLIKQNDERIKQNAVRINKNDSRFQQNEERIQQNEIANRDQLLRTEFFIVQQMRPWWKKFLGIQEKFELKR